MSETGVAETNTQGVQVQTAMGVTEKKALELLGSGWGPELVAQTLGVSVSRISQFLAIPEFAAAVQDRRFKSLQKHSEHDTRLDNLEHTIAQNLEKTLPFLMKPQDQLRALSMLNGLKRRGQIDAGSSGDQAPVVTLLMPTFITQKFTTNINNQVINAGGQVLETIQSNTLMKQTRAQMTEAQQLLLDSTGIERTVNELSNSERSNSCTVESSE